MTMITASINQLANRPLDCQRQLRLRDYHKNHRFGCIEGKLLTEQRGQHHFSTDKTRLSMIDRLLLRATPEVQCTIV
jgi:hypothetical protein